MNRESNFVSPASGGFSAEEQNALDTTEELLREPARRERLLRAVEDIRAGRNIITPDQSLFT